MIELIYTSRVVSGFSGETMRVLLEQCRRNNAAFDITGLLFFGSDRFIQILEGPETNIERVYKSISLDKRHSHVTLLHKSEISRRSFGNWLMSYEPISENDLKKLENLNNVIETRDVMEITQDDKKNYGAHLFGILTGAALSA